MPTGWCPGDRSIPDMLTMYPDTSAVRIFFQPGEGLPARAWSDPTVPARYRLADLPAGCLAIVSFKDLDVDRSAFVDAWQQHRPDVALDLVPHHEPEQQTGGDPTKAQFDASWTKTREQVGNHPARLAGRLRLGVCFTLVWVRQGRDWRTWFPLHEASAVDVVYGDWYPYDPTSSTPWKPTRYEDPVTALKALEDIGAATGKPVGIAEINHERITATDPDGTLCAEWYKRMHAHAKARGYVAWTHFHKGGGDLANRVPEREALRMLIEQEKNVTTAPECLSAVRSLLLDHLEIDPAALGIVGDPAHRGGYHCGSDRVVSGDYSVTESSRDRLGLSSYASALDVGTFTYGSHNLQTFSRWLVAECAAGAEDTKDIREVIYSPDGQVVKRWDRLGKRTSGDSSHLWHTHISFHRDATKANRDQSPIFRRYLEHIGAITTEDPDMTPDEGRKAAFLGTYDAWYQMASGSTTEGRFMAKQFATVTTPLVKAQTDPLRLEVAGLRAVVDGISTQLAAGSGSVDVSTILAGVDKAVQDAEQRIKAEQRDAVADLGEGGSAQVRAQQA